jgi:cytochrome c-type biogenesis protein CcmE
MTKRQQKLAIIVAGVLALAAAAGLVLRALNSNVSFFYTPTEVSAGKAPKDRAFRLGGMVTAGSLKRADHSLNVVFEVTDTVKVVPVKYSGLLPDLFKEGKGVVAQGKMNSAGEFEASEVLAKHDENYMPPEAAAAMKAGAAAKKSGTEKP